MDGNVSNGSLSQPAGHRLQRLARRVHGRGIDVQVRDRAQAVRGAPHGADQHALGLERVRERCGAEPCPGAVEEDQVAVDARLVEGRAGAARARQSAKARALGVILGEGARTWWSRA